MSCHIYRRLVSERSDGMLAAELDPPLTAHLALCRDCAEHERDLAGLGRLLAEHRVAEPPVDLERTIAAAIAADRRRLWPRLLRLLGGWIRPPVLWPSSGAAAGALLLTALILAGADGRPTSGAAGAPEAMALPREASLLTVWDTSAETIVAAVDPTGLMHRTDLPAAIPASPGRAPIVRIFLFERIVVRG